MHRAHIHPQRRPEKRDVALWVADKCPAELQRARKHFMFNGLPNRKTTPAVELASRDVDRPPVQIPEACQTCMVAVLVLVHLSRNKANCRCMKRVCAARYPTGRTGECLGQVNITAPRLHVESLIIPGVYQVEPGGSITPSLLSFRLLHPVSGFISILACPK